MNLNIHRIESVVIEQIKTIEHDDGRKTYVRSIIIKNYQGSFEVRMFSNDINNLNIKDKE